MPRQDGEICVRNLREQRLRCFPRDPAGPVHGHLVSVAGWPEDARREIRIVGIDVFVMESARFGGNSNIRTASKVSAMRRHHPAIKPPVAAGAADHETAAATAARGSGRTLCHQAFQPERIDLRRFRHLRMATKNRLDMVRRFQFAGSTFRISNRCASRVGEIPRAAQSRRSSDGRDRIRALAESRRPSPPVRSPVFSASAARTDGKTLAV